MLQKRLMTSFRLKIGQKNVQLSKSDLGKPKIGKFPLLSNLKFSEVFCEFI